MSTIIEPTPSSCPGCRRITAPGEMLAGWQPCACPGARNGGHRIYECQLCGLTTYTTRHTDDRLSAAYWRRT